MYDVKISSSDIVPYVTKDGSLIRELIHPILQEGSPISLAEATISRGTKTLEHIHETSHEIYYILEGHGRMFLGPEEFDVRPGDSILIEPGTTHCIRNTGEAPLRLLCCCHPPYDHKDTHILG